MTQREREKEDMTTLRDDGGESLLQRVQSDHDLTELDHGGREAGKRERGEELLTKREAGSKDRHSQTEQIIEGRAIGRTLILWAGEVQDRSQGCVSQIL